MNINVDSKIIIYENEKVLLIYIQLPQKHPLCEIRYNFFPKANKKSQKSRARTKHDEVHLTEIGIYLFIGLSLPEGQRTKTGGSSHEEVAGAAGARREYRPFEISHGLINVGLFPPSDEKETILKASNILKQKLFAEDFFLSQVNVKSLKTGYGSVQAAREEALKGMNSVWGKHLKCYHCHLVIKNLD